MKINFDVEQDFTSTYDMGVYGGKLVVEVKDGKVTLDLQEGLPMYTSGYLQCPDLEKAITKTATTTEDTNISSDVPYPLIGDTATGDQIYTSEEGSLYPSDDEFYAEIEMDSDNDVEEDEEVVETESFQCDSPVEDDIRDTSEYKFIKKIEELDKSGVVLDILDSILTKKNTSEFIAKTDKIFKKVMKELTTEVEKIRNQFA